MSTECGYVRFRPRLDRPHQLSADRPRDGEDTAEELAQRGYIEIPTVGWMHRADLPDFGDVNGPIMSRVMKMPKKQLKTWAPTFLKTHLAVQAKTKNPFVRFYR